MAGEGWRLESLQSPPKRHLNPDVVAVLADGRRVGVEVTELRDERSAERAQAVKDGRETAHLYRTWDAASIQVKLCGHLRKKDRKRPTALLCKDGKSRAWGDPLDEYLIVVHTDEPLIGVREADAALMQMAPLSLSQVTRAFFLIWYVPKSAGSRPKIYEISILTGSS